MKGAVKNKLLLNTSLHMALSAALLNTFLSVRLKFRFNPLVAITFSPSRFPTHELVISTRVSHHRQPAVELPLRPEPMRRAHDGDDLPRAYRSQPRNLLNDLIVRVPASLFEHPLARHLSRTSFL
jgi:hypothetical protein